MEIHVFKAIAIFMCNALNVKILYQRLNDKCYFLCYTISINIKKGVFELICVFVMSDLRERNDLMLLKAQDRVLSCLHSAKMETILPQGLH